jgi:hypothetical protein
VPTQISLLKGLGAQQLGDTLQLTDAFVSRKSSVEYDFVARLQASFFESSLPASKSFTDWFRGEPRMPRKLFARELTLAEEISHALHFRKTLLTGDLRWSYEILMGWCMIDSCRETGFRPGIEVLVDSAHGHPGLLAKCRYGKARGTQRGGRIPYAGDQIVPGHLALLTPFRRTTAEQVIRRAGDRRRADTSWRRAGVLPCSFLAVLTCSPVPLLACATIFLRTRKKMVGRTGHG